MIRTTIGLLLLFTLLGCKSHPLGPYVSPAIIGQVFSADTSNALAGVTVIRGPADTSKGSPPKGGELLMRKVPAKTDQDGRFELVSERVLSVVRGTDWDVVALTFERAGYRRFQTNCLTVTLTNAPGGESVLDLGRIYLQPGTNSHRGAGHVEDY